MTVTVGGTTQTEVSRRTALKAFGGLAAATTGVAGCGRGGSTGSGDSLQFLLLGPTPQLLDAFNKNLIPAFAKQENIKVELQTSDWGSGFQKVLTAASSHSLPDVLTIGGIWTAPLVAKGALLPLDKYTADWPERSKYYGSIWKDCQYKGKTYAVPIYSGVPTVAYRADLFERAGLDPDTPPTTWDEYRQYAEKLVHKKGSRLVTEGADWGLDTSIGLQQTFAQLMFQAGGTYYRADGRSNFASDEGKNALEYLVSFYKDGLSSVNVVNQLTAAAPLVSGAAAMSFTNVSVLANAKINNKSVVAQIRAGRPLKSTPDGKPTTSAWINKFGLAATTKKADAGWKWLQFLSEKSNLEALDEQYGLLPPRTDLVTAPYLHGAPEGFISCSEDVVPQPPNPQMLQIAQVINTELQRAIRMQTGSSDALAAIDKQVDGLTGA